MDSDDEQIVFRRRTRPQQRRLPVVIDNAQPEPAPARTGIPAVEPDLTVFADEPVVVTSRRQRGQRRRVFTGLVASDEPEHAASNNETSDWRIQLQDLLEPEQPSLVQEEPQASTFEAKAVEPILADAGKDIGSKDDNDVIVSNGSDSSDDSSTSSPSSSSSSSPAGSDEDYSHDQQSDEADAISIHNSDDAVDDDNDHTKHAPFESVKMSKADHVDSDASDSDDSLALDRDFIGLDGQSSFLNSSKPSMPRRMLGVIDDDRPGRDDMSDDEESCSDWEQEQLRKSGLDTRTLHDYFANAALSRNIASGTSKNARSDPKLKQTRQQQSHRPNRSHQPQKNAAWFEYDSDPDEADRMIEDEKRHLRRVEGMERALQMIEIQDELPNPAKAKDQLLEKIGGGIFGSKFTREELTEAKDHRKADIDSLRAQLAGLNRQLREMSATAG